MSYRYDHRSDRMVGHDYPGVHGGGFVQWERDELEVGGRAALALDDPDQAWWETVGRTQMEEMETNDAKGTSA